MVFNCRSALARDYGISGAAVYRMYWPHRGQARSYTASRTLFKQRIQRLFQTGHCNDL